MKIVHINTNDSGGGAAIACFRHCEAMVQSGIDSKMIVISKKTQNENIIQYRGPYIPFLFNRFINRIVAKYTKRLNAIGKFSYMFPGISFDHCEDVKDADIIVIHWINNGALSLNGLKKILDLGKPTYWYMHDMFPITGGCHHSLGCNGYEDGCKSCRIVKNSQLPSFCYIQQKKNAKTLAQYSNLIFVAPSVWLSELTKRSIIANNHKILHIQNFINTDLFKPQLKDTKGKYGLDKNKTTILFGNASIESPYKGMQYSIDCLRLLNANKYEALIVGGDFDGLAHDVKMNIISTGFLKSDMEMIDAYNACDIVLITSVAENYPNMVLEAMACGKPCVGFPTGGIPDLIHHQISGYLTNDYKASSLKEGIEWISNKSNYTDLSKNARRQILEYNSYMYFKRTFLQNENNKAFV